MTRIGTEDRSDEPIRNSALYRPSAKETTSVGRARIAGVSRDIMGQVRGRVQTFLGRFRG
jgi:hypothetical protein